MKKWLLFLLKLAFTMACLWWAFSGIDFRHSALAHPGALDWPWIAGGILLGGATVLLSAARWWLLLRAQGIPATLWRITELTLIGNLFNLFAVGGVGGDAAIDEGADTNITGGIGLTGEVPLGIGDGISFAAGIELEEMIVLEEHDGLDDVM